MNYKNKNQKEGQLLKKINFKRRYKKLEKITKINFNKKERLLKKNSKH